MHKIFKPEETPKDYNFEETCPHCDTSLPVVIDDKDNTYETVCPVCGNKIMLCTLCMWDQSDNENDPGDCDWTEREGCYRKRKEK